MGRPRIVHLTTVHAPFDPRIFWKEAVSLRGAGYDVYLVAQHTHAETVEGVQIVPLRPIEGRYRRIVLQREAFSKARKLQAEVYHFHDPELIPVAYALKRTTGARIVYDVHEDYRGHGPVEGRLLSSLERWCFAWVDHVVLAEQSYEARVPAGVPHTVVLNFFRPFRQQAPGKKRRDPSSYSLLNAGVLGRDRGLDTLLDVAAKAQAQSLPWRLTLAGICNLARDRQAIEQRIQREDLGQIVQRIGWDTYVPWHAMEPHYVASDVGLALFAARPNYVASVPTKFYEYLYYGLPILCSDFSLWRRFVERHGCGAVVSPGDAAQAYAVLKQWYEQPALYEKLSAAAAQAASRYLWKSMEGRLLGLYEELLNRS